MKKPLVSIIVPIYNVEEYIQKCVDSLIRQSYSNLEIILVNDGSPDQSGFIADRLAKNESRISVIHQENSGVSNARNAGLDEAAGEYICFVDADDWLSPYFIEELVELSLIYDADFVLSETVLTSEVSNKPKNAFVRTWSSEEATEALLYADIIIGCWNKLYKRQLIENHKLRFLPEYFMGEGLNFITTYSQVSSKIVVTDEPLYYYRRDNAESATTNISVQKMQNALLAINNIRKNIIVDSKRVSLALDFHEWWTCLNALRIINAQGARVLHDVLYSDCYNLLRKEAFRMLVRTRISFRRKIIVFAIWLFPSTVIWAAEKKDT